VKSVAAIERAGFAVEHNAQYPGVASIHTPEGERIELFDDELATNLGFTIDARQRPPGTAGVPQMQEQFAADATAERHNRKLGVPIIAHHIHLNVPQDQVAAAKEWYATHFGGVRASDGATRPSICPASKSTSRASMEAKPRRAAACSITSASK
jgi:hypothetical protein